MAGKVLAHIGAFDLVLLAAFVGDDDNFDAPRPFKERDGIGNGARCRPTTVPAHHDVVELERGFLDVGHDDDRPAGIEQGGFDDLLFNRARPGSACSTTERSKYRAIRPNCSPAPSKLAPGVSGSAETPARALAVVNRSIAAFAAAALSRRCISITSGGMLPASKLEP